MEEVTLWNVIINTNGEITQLKLDGKSKKDIIMKVVQQHPEILKTATSIGVKESFQDNPEIV